MELGELTDRLASTVETRRQSLPAVSARIDQLAGVERSLAEARLAGTDLPPEWAGDPDVRDALNDLRSPDLDARLDEAKALLRGVEARFARDTINVGVSGRARVGKSAMLQSISGLTDEQVPTGEGANVTAVRSRIFHGAQTQAVITFHSSTSFLDEIVLPYFRDLEIWPSPTSLGDFASLNLAALQPDSPDASSQFRIDARWRRLREIQAAIPSLRLDGATVTITDLSDLRRFVAYPSTFDVDSEDAGGQPAKRDYLCVRDCRIDAPFPVTALDRLGLVDLPGLGESAAGIDSRIVSGLKGNVDVVLMVFRAAVGLANIDDTDRGARGLIAQAQGPVADSRDFTWIVVNAGPKDEANRAELLSLLQRDFNDRKPDSQYFILVGNALDPESMHRDVLLPVLNRLAERLPAMDQQYLAGAIAKTEPLLGEIGRAARALRAAIGSVGSQSGSIRQALDVLADDLRKDIQQSLAMLRPESLVEEYVDQYVERIEEVDADVRVWLSKGLGLFQTKQEWMDRARAEWGIRRSHRPFANDELHRLRVAVTTRYSDLDTFVNEVLVERFYRMVGDAIAGEAEGTPNKAEADRSFLLESAADRPSANFEALWANIAECDPGVPGLVKAVERLKGIRFDFRIQAYPLLHELNLDKRPVDAANGNEGYPPEFAEEAVDYMYDWFETEFSRFAYDVKKALREDAPRQFRVLSGAAVVFEDEVVRSGTSHAEFRNLADGYRDELWPGRFDDLNRASARVKHLSRCAAQLVATVEAAGAQDDKEEGQP